MQPIRRRNWEGPIWQNKSRRNSHKKSHIFLGELCEVCCSCIASAPGCRHPLARLLMPSVGSRLCSGSKVGPIIAIPLAGLPPPPFVATPNVSLHRCARGLLRLKCCLRRPLVPQLFSPVGCIRRRRMNMMYSGVGTSEFVCQNDICGSQRRHVVIKSPDLGTYSKLIGVHEHGLSMS